MKKAKPVLALFLAAAILFRPQISVDAAQRAMHSWYSSVAPALFPFLALMPLLTGRDACRIYEKLFAPLMRPLFHLPGSAAPAVIIGLIAGSPGGAVALAALARESKMSKAQIRRLAPAICGVGPAYLVLGVGVGLFGSAKTGMAIAAVQMAVQLLLLFVSRRDDQEEITGPTIVPMPGQRNGIAQAVETVLSVCGYMVLFSVAAAAVSDIIGKNPGRWLLIAADLPSGLASLAEWQLPGRTVVAGMAVGFGGICIIAQNMDVLRHLGLQWKDMLIKKAAASVLCGLGCMLILPDLPAAAADMCVKSSIPYAFSVLAALILCLPVLIYLSDKLFLNKRKSAGSFSS